MRRALIWLVVLVCVGLIWAGAQAPQRYPVPQQQAIEMRHAREIEQQKAEERQRLAVERDDEEAGGVPAGWDEH
jgi:hypothetical protein